MVKKEVALLSRILDEEQIEILTSLREREERR